MERLLYDSQELTGSLLNSVKRCTTILIVTAADAENNAVVEELNKHPLPFNRDDNGQPKVGLVHANPLFHITLYADFLIAHLHLISMGEKTFPFELSDATKVLENIKLVIMPGMAFGLHSHSFIWQDEEHGDLIPLDQGGQRKGDIIVATEIIDTTQDHPEPKPINPYIVGHLREYANTYKPLKDETIFFGPFLHVTTVIDNKEQRTEYRNKYGNHRSGEINARAGEMEGNTLHDYGQFSIQNPGRQQIYFMIAKAICDWGFGKPKWNTPERPQHDAERLAASRNAFAFCMHVLRSMSRNLWMEGVQKYDPACLSWRPAGNMIAATEERGDTAAEINKWRAIRNSPVYPETMHVSTYVRRLIGEGDPLQCLIITGRGGIGKTFFAKQIRLELCERLTNSRHLWLDCPSNQPTAQILLDYLANFLPEDQISDFKQTTLQYLKEDGDLDAFKANGRLHRYLSSKLLSDQFSPLFFYFDDLDRYTSELERPESAVGSFFKAFLQQGFSLRIIATSRSNRLDSVIKRLVEGKRKDIEATGDTLPCFEADIPRAYLETRGGLKNYLSDADFDTFLELSEGDPLSLHGVEDIFEYAQRPGVHIEDKNALATLKAELTDLLAAHSKRPIPVKHRVDAVRSLAYKSVVSSWPPVTRSVVESLAVLNDPNFTPFEWPEGNAGRALIHKLLQERGKSFPELVVDGSIQELYDRNILLKDAYTFFDDRLKDYLYNRWFSLQERMELHQCASTILDSHRFRAYAIWHKLHSGKINDAFDELMEYSALLNAKYQSSHLRALHTRFRVALWIQAGKTWKESVGRQNLRWYINQGKLAEVLYYGFSLASTVDRFKAGPVDIRKQDVWELFQDAIKYLQGHDMLSPSTVEDRKLQEWIMDTYARCLILRAVFVFEGSAPEDHGLGIALSPRPNEWLAEQTGEVLAEFAKINGHEGGNTPPLTSIIANFQACCYNGGKLLPQAIDAFRKAVRILDEYEICLPHRTKANLEELKPRFHRDRLDIANSWSRSRFLLKGPDYALDAGSDALSPLERFQEFVDAGRGEYRDTLEFNYCLVNLCYYLLAKRDLESMLRYLSLAYDLKGRSVGWLNDLRHTSLVRMVDPDLPIQSERFEKPQKRSYDSWSEGYLDALEAAHYFYSHPMTNPAHVHTARKAFEMCAKAFDSKHFGYRRDRCLMMVNSILVDLCAAEEMETKRQKLAEIEATLISEKAYDEPIARDTLAYLKVWLGMLEIDESEPTMQAVEETIMRFPGLLGEGKPAIDSPDWRPPLLFRGALLMVPVPRAPIPIELGIKEWIPCP